MSDSSGNAAPRNISQALSDTIATFSDDAQQVTLRKAKELGFDLNKGVIPFDETLLNLTNDRDVLLDAIEKNRLTQLPLKIQQGILADAKKVSAHLASIALGSDSIIPLENAVEDLTASVWSSSLQHLSGELLAFTRKMNQLKTLEGLLGHARRKAEDFLERESKAICAISQIDSYLEAALTSSSKITEVVAAQESTASRIKEIEQQTTASHATIQENAKNSTDSAAKIGVYASETEASAKRTKELLSEADSLKEALRTTDEAMKALRSSTEETLKTSLNSFEAKLAALEAELKTSQGVHETKFTALEAATKIGIEASRKAASDAVDLLKTETSTTISASLSATKTNSDALLATIQKAENDRATRAQEQLTASKSEFAAAAIAAKEIYSAKFAELEITAEGVVSKNESELRRLTEELKKLEDVIREKIELATNYQLFHSFQTRQLAIEKSKNFWAKALAACVMLSACASMVFIWYLKYVSVYNAAFYLKLSISLPIVFAITFCSMQFTRERNLEEEYAFKANISISLDPYRKLVSDLVNEDDPADRAKYADFVIESINKVFTAPTSHHSDGTQPNGELITGVLKEVSNIIEPIAKVLRR
jgi:hypothetical protein